MSFPQCVCVRDCSDVFQNGVVVIAGSGPFLFKKFKKKAKESRNRLGVAQRVPGGLGSQISMTIGI